MDETDLATELEKSCFLEPELEGTYRRRYVEAPHEAVGLAWTGILEFFPKSKAQIVALCKAVLRAFAGRSVKVQIRSGDKELEVVARNTSLVELRQTVEALCESTENAE